MGLGWRRNTPSWCLACLVKECDAIVRGSVDTPVLLPIPGWQIVDVLIIVGVDLITEAVDVSS